MITFLERPEGLPAANGYSHAAIATGPLVFVSGQVPLDAEGNLAGPDMEAQADRVFRNLQSVLVAAGADWTQVVKLTFYLTDIADLAALRIVRDRYLEPGRLPASSLVEVSALVHPDFRIEADAIAVLADRET